MDKKSCQNCSHYYVCQFRGEPYQGNYSGGYRAHDYARFKEEYYQMMGRNCEDYEDKHK